MGDAPRGLLWALDEEMLTPTSSEGAALERVCRHYNNSGNVRDRDDNDDHDDSNNNDDDDHVARVSVQCANASNLCTAKFST